MGGRSPERLPVGKQKDDGPTGMAAHDAYLNSHNAPVNLVR